MNIVKLLDTKPKKATQTTVDTIVITPSTVRQWKNPPFQRPLKVNAKVTALAQQIKGDGGVMPGVVTLGILNRQEYLLDGQHRREAFLLSGCSEGFTDIRKHFFDSMAEMGMEFVNLNSQLVRLRPDDILRGMEGSNEGLAAIRKSCGFVGYDMIRRSDHSPVLSMSTALRAWFGSASDIPSNGGMSALESVKMVTSEEGDLISAALLLLHGAWGRDPEYHKLWGALNLTIVLWLYRRMVLTEHSHKVKRIGKDLFGKCCASLSADGAYLEWLYGRGLSERDRSPAFGRIKRIFVARLNAETNTKNQLPSPAWAHHQAGLR